MNPDPQPANTPPPDAVAWLRDRLTGAGPVALRTLKLDAFRVGIGPMTLMRAGQALGVEITGSQARHLYALPRAPAT